MFNYSFAIIEPSTQLIEVLLYPNYSPGDLSKFLELDLDIEEEKGYKVYNVAKKFSSLPPQKLEKIVNLYHTSKINDFKQMYQFKPSQIFIFKAKG